MLACTNMRRSWSFCGPGKVLLRILAPNVNHGRNTATDCAGLELKGFLILRAERL